MKNYRDKRNFSRTAEPRGGRRQNKSKNRPIFVIQRHDATADHYDFRIEVDGVLKSWAVPKGPSTDPRNKRLAIETEDHPVEYAKFEGVIPEGEYGAGTVMVWDRGYWTNSTEKDGKERSASAALKSGHILMTLYGDKIRGGYALQRIRRGDKPQWLLIKMDDDETDRRRNPVSTQKKSVLSGRTMREIARESAKATARKGSRHG